MGDYPGPRKGYSREIPKVGERGRGHSFDPSQALFPPGTSYQNKVNFAPRALRGRQYSNVATVESPPRRYSTDYLERHELPRQYCYDKGQRMEASRSLRPRAILPKKEEPLSRHSEQRLRRQISEPVVGELAPPPGNRLDVLLRRHSVEYAEPQMEQSARRLRSMEYNERQLFGHISTAATFEPPPRCYSGTPMKRAIRKRTCITPLAQISNQEYINLDEISSSPQQDIDSDIIFVKEYFLDFPPINRYNNDRDPPAPMV